MATIRELNKVGAILDAAIEAGANSIRGVSFRIDDPDSPQSEAWEQAVVAALAKAEKLAAPYNAKVGDLITVSEVVGGGRGYFASGFASVRGLGDGGGTLSSGELELSLGLQVVYGIQQMKQRRNRLPSVEEATQMGGRELIGWTAFALFVLAMAVMVLMILSPAVERYDIVSPEAMVWAVGVLALLATFAGFLAFTTPQGKVAAIGGLLLLIAMILVTPVAVKISPGSPTHLE